MSRALPKVPPWFATGWAITLEHTQMTLVPPQSPKAGATHQRHPLFTPALAPHGTAFDDSRTFDLIQALTSAQAHVCQWDVDYPRAAVAFLEHIGFSCIVLRWLHQSSLVLAAWHLQPLRWRCLCKQVPSPWATERSQCCCTLQPKTSITSSLSFLRHWISGRLGCRENGAVVSAAASPSSRRCWHQAPVSRPNRPGDAACCPQR